ncbi:MAG: hypothetical protein PSU94_08080 [Lacunisphaera sp.]|nr:hypothetical protein [Lacunisphaera sp.]
MRLWKKLEIVENPPVYIGADDECYYARDYIARGSYKDSEANQLISNFKRHPKFRASPAWRYKLAAIDRFARELAAAVTKNVAIAGIPSSKLADHPEYDSRLVDVLQTLAGLRPDLTVESPFGCKESTVAAHLGGSRSVDEINANLVWRGLSPGCRVLILVDDVLTSGAHFKACKRLVATHAPGVRVAGVFWARTVWPEPANPFEDVSLL